MRSIIVLTICCAVAYGIAPPQPPAPAPPPPPPVDALACPSCDSRREKCFTRWHGCSCCPVIAVTTVSSDHGVSYSFNGVPANYTSPLVLPEASYIIDSAALDATFPILFAADVTLDGSFSNILHSSRGSNRSVVDVSTFRSPVAFWCTAEHSPPTALSGNVSLA